MRCCTAGALEERPESEVAQLALARVLIVKGDAPARERALALLDPPAPGGGSGGRAGVQIEALALRALAHWHGGDRAGAMVSLERALRLAEPEGYVRLFADLGHAHGPAVAGSPLPGRDAGLCRTTAGRLRG